ncbi:MAG: hypothetical protein E7373_04065 [Clostridiales bacterium]|nr:hypothetical protein [Clostridiales bacterium]
MKGWKITKPLTLNEVELTEDVSVNSLTKVKITKALVTLSDVLRYKNEIDGESVVLGSAGVGVVSETEANLFGLEKGKHVYVEPNKECTVCPTCKRGNPSKCANLQTAGIDYDGFLSDFTAVDAGKLFMLPENITDLEALFIGQISLAVAVVDKLNVQKGEYVAVIGANNFGNILSQLLIYYQAVPILMTTNDEDLQIAKDAGIYYVLGKDDNWQKETFAITGGKMPKSVVYVADCNIPVQKAYSLASCNASVAFTGVSSKNNSISFAQAMKKQLNIHCIANGAGNTAASINLLANKAINLSPLKLDSETYQNVPKVIEKMSELLDKEGKIYETVIDIV